jgi:hypothetical protein
VGTQLVIFDNLRQNAAGHFDKLHRSTSFRNKISGTWKGSLGQTRLAKPDWQNQKASGLDPNRPA